MLGIDYKDISSQALRYAPAHRLTFPNLRDLDGSFAGAYGTVALPETFVLDRRLRVVAIARGELTSEAWLAQRDRGGGARMRRAGAGAAAARARRRSRGAARRHRSARRCRDRVAGDVRDLRDPACGGAVAAGRPGARSYIQQLIDEGRHRGADQAGARRAVRRAACSPCRRRAASTSPSTSCRSRRRALLALVALLLAALAPARPPGRRAAGRRPPAPRAPHVRRPPGRRPRALRALITSASGALTPSNPSARAIVRCAASAERDPQRLGRARLRADTRQSR